ncbi:MAG: hypothetical protein ACE5KD_01285 [Candidatus Bathyarchaeia archaeon]
MIKPKPKPKRKRPVDLLALSRKERIRLCKEIRNILQQRILEGKNSQWETKREKRQLRGNEGISAKTLKSHFTRIKNRQIWKRLV